MPRTVDLKKVRSSFVDNLANGVSAWEGSLPFSQAANLALCLDGSLEWLAGSSLHRGSSPTEERFDEKSRRAHGIE